MAFQGKILAEKDKKGIFRPKIRTWTTMPLKVGIINTFRGLVTDNSRKEIIVTIVPKFSRE
jgi:hypothetical protein